MIRTFQQERFFGEGDSHFGSSPYVLLSFSRGLVHGGCFPKGVGRLIISARWDGWVRGGDLFLGGVVLSRLVFSLDRHVSAVVVKRFNWHYEIAFLVKVCLGFAVLHFLSN